MMSTALRVTYVGTKALLGRLKVKMNFVRGLFTSGLSLKTPQLVVSGAVWRSAGTCLRAKQNLAFSQHLY